MKVEKIEISKVGQLVLHRTKSRKTPTACPFNSTEIYCGDWCPHFGEPVQIREYYHGHDESPYIYLLSLSCCRDVEIYAKELEDKRGGD